MNENYLKQLGDQIALTHWAQSNEKTYEEICDRVVNYICDDQSEEGRNYNRRMKELLKSKKFIPNSPCWINSGTDMKNLFACYVIDLKDNMNSIMDAAKRMAMIMKEGGGVGISLTPIRAEGARVGGEGSNRTASGPISFLKVFDSVVGAVKSAGVRRGAALANLKTGHPDIIKFIKCKEDQNQINNFNLSVAITDEFMDDVINKSTREWAEDDEAAYTASDIYDMIVEHMWNNGEPGVQFIDTVNNVDGKYTGRPEFREFNTGIEVSNPCVTGDTQILTDKGYFPIKDLIGKKVNIWNGFEWSEVEPRKTGEDQKLLKITFSNGSEIRCTPYHKFIIVPRTARGKIAHKGHGAAVKVQRKEAKDLIINDNILKHNWPVIEGTEELLNAYTQGFFSGDGDIRHERKERPNGKVYEYDWARVRFYSGAKVKVMSRCAISEDYSKKLEDFKQGKTPNVPCHVLVPYLDKTFVPDCRFTVKSRLDWLAGLLDADGYINTAINTNKNKKYHSIQLCSIDKGFLIKVSKLLNTLGIGSSVSRIAEARESFLPGGKCGYYKLYKCKELYALYISTAQLQILIDIGLKTSRLDLSGCSLAETGKLISSRKYIRVTNISECEEREDVYCLTEPKNHSFIANGIITGNCGETFLKPNEACNLASINLYHFVNPFWKGKDEKADMALRQELKQTVEDAVDFLNLMLDKSETPFDEINEAVHQSRKVGLGVMGLADYLSAKGIVYGSPEAVHEAADVFAFISKTAEEYSLRKGYKNATLTVQAPTGTTGLVGEVSTGIEPHFLRCWTRHSLKMGDLLMYPKSLRDYLENFCNEDAWGQWDEIKYARKLKDSMENNNFEEFSKLLESEDNVTREIRKYWPTAHEVTPKQHLAMLAAIQRHVHNSVSKTINLPHDATVDDVRELITTAWRSGCKGFTCYRDGSRDSQPLKAVDNKDKSDDPSKDFDAKFKQQLREGKLVVMVSEEYDELLKRAKTLEELNDSVDFDLETAKEVVGQIRSGKFTLVPTTEYDEMREALITMKRFEDDVSKLPPTLLPYKYLVGGRYVKDSDRDFAKDIDVPDKNLPCKRPRPNVTYGETVKTKIGCGSIYITVNKDENGTCEVFTNLGRAGGCPSQSEATSRLISLALRSGVPLEDVIDQLKGIRCMNTMRKGGIKQPDGTVVLSCPDAIGKAMEKISNDWNERALDKIYKPTGLNINDLRDATPEERDNIQSYLMDMGKDTGLDFYSIVKNARIKVDDGDKSIKTQTVLLNGNMVCPDCGKELERDGGCVICRHCGYSKCG